MNQFILNTPIRFFSTPEEDTATIPLQEDMLRLCRGDLVMLSPQHMVLVAGKTRHTISFMRQQQYKRRVLGGIPYRKWARAKREHINYFDRVNPFLEGDEPIIPPFRPAPRRSKPLVFVRPVWKNIHIVAGSHGVALSNAYAEGSV